MYAAIENIEAALNEPIAQTHNHARKMCSDCGELHFNETWGDEQDSSTIDYWAINAKINKQPPPLLRQSK
jgi:hypothetical protein